MKEVAVASARAAIFEGKTWTLGLSIGARPSLVKLADDEDHAGGDKKAAEREEDHEVLGLFFPSRGTEMH